MNQISIITPVFNGASYIEACLENVIHQQCTSVEHLIMDGASTDGTVEIVKEWASEWPHIRLVSEKDQGQSDAMNKGIKRANGSVISFLNVDDYYEANVLNRIIQLFEDLPEPSFVCGNLNIWNPDGSFKHYNRPDKVTLPELISDRFEWPYNPSAYFYHKSLHDVVGMYNVDNHYCMDYEFILNVARNSKIRYLDETWGNFCVVVNSKTYNSHFGLPDTAMQAGEVLREKMKAKMSSYELEQLDQIMAVTVPLNSPESVFINDPGGKGLWSRIASFFNRF